MEQNKRGQFAVKVREADSICEALGVSVEKHEEFKGIVIAAHLVSDTWGEMLSLLSAEATSLEELIMLSFMTGQASGAHNNR